MKENRRAYFSIGLICLCLVLFLIWFIYFKKVAHSTHSFLEILPAVNAVFNSLSAFFLVSGLVAIKNNQKKWHIRFMFAALVSSAIFLVTYLIYHHFHGDSKFGGEGLIRSLYFFILISHIALSIVQLPLILSTLWHVYNKEFEKHKKLARWTWPVWLYVSSTGVLIFFILNIF